MQAATERVRAGEDLSMEEMAALIGGLMECRHEEQETADFLSALHEKGEAVSEIAGAAAAMRGHMTPIRTSRRLLVDTCGTGGDGSGTFNISTAAAIVAAAAEAPIAKHGNRSITSKSGSADVLAALGVNIEAPLATVEKCLEEVGLCFCFAPQMHPAMKNVAKVRKMLDTPTIFNLLGPLCNPAGAPYQVLGVGKPHLRAKLAEALVLLGVERAVVVCGEDGLDEITLRGATHVSEVSGGEVRETAWTPQDFGLEPTDDFSSLQVEGPEASAAKIREVLSGEPGPARDITVLNAAAAIWIAGRADSFVEAARHAAASIDSGRAGERLAKLAEVSHS